MSEEQLTQRINTPTSTAPSPQFSNYMSSPGTSSSGTGSGNPLPPIQLNKGSKKPNLRLRTIFFFDTLPKEYFNLMKTVVKDKFFGYLLSDDPFFKSSEFRLRVSLHVGVKSVTTPTGDNIPSSTSSAPPLYHVKLISDELEKMRKLTITKPFNGKLESDFLFDPHDLTNNYSQFHNCNSQENSELQELKSNFLNSSIHTQINFFILDKTTHLHQYLSGGGTGALIPIEADDNFLTNIIEKTKKYQQNPKSIWEIVGEIYICGEYVLRISEVQFQNRTFGYVVDIEYIPALNTEQTYKMLKNFTELLFEKTKFEYEKENKAQNPQNNVKIDWKSKIQPIPEREQYYVQYAYALGKRKEFLTTPQAASSPAGSIAVEKGKKKESPLVKEEIKKEI